jgi:HEAT repeat protein
VAGNFLAAAKAAEPKAFAPGERACLLNDLKSGDPYRIQMAVDRLANAQADDKPEDFSKVLAFLLNQSDAWLRKSAAEALVIWATPDAEDALIEASRSTDDSISIPSIKALGKIKTAKAAESVAEYICKYAVRDTPQAAKTIFKTMGPVAEDAIIAHLNYQDKSQFEKLSYHGKWVRRNACRVLGECGGKKALEALQDFVQKSPKDEAEEAEKAIAAIQRRLNPEREASNKSDDSRTDSSNLAVKPKVDNTEDFRTWFNGRSSVIARLLSEDGGNVILQTKDGQKLSVRIESLSGADRKYIMDLLFGKGIASGPKEKELEPGERARLLRDLCSSDTKRICDAAIRLAKIPIDDKPADISKALAALLRHSDEWVQTDAAHALEVWVTPEVEDDLVKALDSKNPSVRSSAIKTLGKFRTPKTAKAVAAVIHHDHWYRDFLEPYGPPRRYSKASRILMAMGPVAEAATIECLKDPEVFARCEACEILGEIGGRNALEVLRKFVQRSPANVNKEKKLYSFIENREAKRAIALIELRLESLAENVAQPDDPKTKSSNLVPHSRIVIVDSSDFRTWREKGGKGPVVATLLSIDDDTVALKKKDGNELRIPIEDLSSSDKTYLSKYDGDIALKLDNKPVKANDDIYAVVEVFDEIRVVAISEINALKKTAEEDYHNDLKWYQEHKRQVEDIYNSDMVPYSEEKDIHMLKTSFKSKEDAQKYADKKTEAQEIEAQKRAVIHRSHGGNVLIIRIGTVTSDVDLTQKPRIDSIQKKKDEYDKQFERLNKLKKLTAELILIKEQEERVDETKSMINGEKRALRALRDEIEFVNKNPGEF